MSNPELKNLASDILLNASDYIGNNPELFGADNHALDTIKHNETFRKTISDEITDEPEEYEHLSQQECAQLVWQLYQKWAY